MARSRPVPLLVATLVSVVAIIGVKAVLSRGGDAAVPVAGQPSGPCVTLAVTASSEKAALLTRIAMDWSRTPASVAGRCARVKVTSKASGGAAEALGRGWDEALDGPRPDVWSPASTTWTGLLQQRTAARDAPDLVGAVRPPSIAQTPLVIAMPKPLAEALGWPDKKIGWADISALAADPAGWGRLGKPYGAFKLGKTNPHVSTSGLNATIGAYVAATQRSSDLTLADLADPAVNAYVKTVESSVVHYGDTTLTFLANLQRADDAGQGLTYVSAVAVEEKSVYDYDTGNPSGDPATVGRHGPARTPLVAIYPKEGTLLSDNPYAVLAGPWVDDGKRAVAAAFLAHLQSAPVQGLFTAAGFRDATGRPGVVINRASGTLPEQPEVVLGAPSPAVLAGVQAAWDQQRKRARLLLVIDVSGSMGEPVGSAGASKLDLAKRAAATAVDQLAPDDQVSLWVFSTGQDGTLPYRKVVPFGTAKDVLAPVRAAIGGLQPGGGTGLYATVRAANRALSDSADPSRINAVVVLTDGRNEYPADNRIQSLVDELDAEDPTATVRVFPIAYGDDADLGELKKIAEASRGAAYDASDPATIDRVFTAVLSNF